MLLSIILACALPVPQGSTAQNNFKKTGQEKEALITFTKKDDGREYQFQTGQTFKVILPENPTTGYRWMVAEPAGVVEPVDEPVVLLRQKYTPERHGHAHAGSGGVRTMIFQAKNKGPADLVLLLRRPWEAEGGHVDSFNLILDIR
jgi:inhibitor of cysteine peptidase